MSRCFVLRMACLLTSMEVAVILAPTRLVTSEGALEPGSGGNVKVTRGFDLQLAVIVGLEYVVSLVAQNLPGLLSTITC